MSSLSTQHSYPRMRVNIMWNDVSSGYDVYRCDDAVTMNRGEN